jgi:hypothetical protein
LAVREAIAGCLRPDHLPGPRADNIKNYYLSKMNSKTDKTPKYFRESLTNIAYTALDSHTERAQFVARGLAAVDYLNSGVIPLI